ncbi:hypothetical protein [Anaeroselena agilis]|uniref:LPS export ABC transporter periplasmic protein LptC n=1 Tax=Anaeroselena agilis TaxID=3063788 RepID=A0ABU3P4Z5_9FIRM|nr:hypothetical protein [Selenomonadales bacterium 4137-cl]
MRKIILLGLGLAALLLLGWDAHRWYDARAAREPAFRSRATANELSGWRDGRQRWRIRAAEITRTDGGVDAVGIRDGSLRRDGDVSLRFSAPRAGYREKDGLLRFPGGVVFTLDGKTLRIADGVYDDKACAFRGGGVQLASGPESQPRWEVHAAGITYGHDGTLWQLEKKVNIKWRSAPGSQPYTLTTTVLILDEDFAGAAMPGPVALAGGSLAGAAAAAAWDGDTLTLQRVALRDESWSAALAAGAATRRDGAWLFVGVDIRRDNGDTWRADRLELGDGGAVAFAGVAGTIGDISFSADKLLSDDRENYRTAGAVTVRPRAGVTLAAQSLAFAESEKRYRFTKPRLRQDNGTEITADAGLFDGKRRNVAFAANVVTVMKDGREIRAATAAYDLDSRVVEYTGAVSSVRRAGREGENR